MVIAMVLCPAIITILARHYCSYRVSLMTILVFFEREYTRVHLLPPKQHSMWAPVGPQLGKLGPQMVPGWA